MKEKRPSRHSATVLVTITVALTLSSIPLRRVNASAGDLDPKFGLLGKVVTPLGVVAWAQAVAIQPDAKIIAAGVSMTRGIYYAEDFALVRYNPDGSLDSTFGEGGTVTTDYFADQDHVNAVVLQKDGRILAAGRARKGADIYFGLARYNANGSLDLSFGSGGKVVTSFFGHGDDAHAMAIQPDGKIVVGGSAFSASPIPSEGIDVNFGIARYNADGSLDPTFGAGGRVSANFGIYGIITVIAIQPDGKIVAAGITTSASTDSDFAVARFNADGSIDKDFGSKGHVVTDFLGYTDFVAGIGLQSDGKIVLAGDVTTKLSVREDRVGFGLARYNNDGSIDKSFGSEGKVITEGLLRAADAVVIQPNGKIVAAGLAINGKDADFGLARYNANGSLDSSFGLNGVITTDFEGGDRAFALAIQADGKLMAAGSTSKPGVGPLFALARYDIGDIAKSFDIHLQDDSSLLEFDSTTGEYEFTDCGSGFVLAGVGTVKVRSCKITLRDSSPEFDLNGKVNVCDQTGKTSLQVFSQGLTYSLKDRDITDGGSPCR